MMLIILLVSLLAISGVSAAENATDDVIGIDETDNVVNSENHVNENVEDSDVWIVPQVYSRMTKINNFLFGKRVNHC